MNDFRPLAHLEEQLGAERWKSLIDPANTGKIKKFLDSLLPILIAIATVIVLRPVLFVAEEKFFKKDSAVKFSTFWGNFRNCFFCKVENWSCSVSNTLYYYSLNKPSVADSILAELGGEINAATRLGEVWNLLEKQASGEEGVLLVNGHNNLFFVKDVREVLRVVNVRWCSNGWNVGAYSVDDPENWSAGSRVFSHGYGS